MEFKKLDSKMKEIYYSIKPIESQQENKEVNVWQYLNGMAVLNISAIQMNTF